jgi:hypothetical protein
MTKKKPVVKPILLDSYIAMIKGSVGSHAYRAFLVTIDGVRHDAVQGGKLSCAFFVTSIVHFFKLLQEPHLTVSGTIADLKERGWKTTRTPKPGDIIVWEPSLDHTSDEPHRHIGFFMGKNRAISNSSKMRMPAIHHWTFGKNGKEPKRKIEMVLTHSKLR